MARYGLIADGDRIVVAVSGGLDSLTLLRLLVERRRFSRESYDLFAVTVIPRVRGFDESGNVLDPSGSRLSGEENFGGASTRGEAGDQRGTKPLRDLYDRWGVEYGFREILITPATTHGKRLGCYWCARQRRKALFETARGRGSGKIAIGHHRDDAVETILMNLFYHGTMGSLSPSEEFLKGLFTVIRPMILISRRDILHYAKTSGFPCHQTDCPVKGQTRRAEIRRLIREREKEMPFLRKHLLRASRVWEAGR